MIIFWTLSDRQPYARDKNNTSQPNYHALRNAYAIHHYDEKFFHNFLDHTKTSSSLLRFSACAPANVSNSSKYKEVQYSEKLFILIPKGPGHLLERIQWAFFYFLAEWYIDYGMKLLIVNFYTVTFKNLSK